ncbi:unnamed protein product [Gadus morhua 'NCC']
MGQYVPKLPQLLFVACQKGRHFKSTYICSKLAGQIGRRWMMGAAAASATRGPAALAWDDSEASDPSGGYLQDEGEKLEPVHVLAGPASCLYRYKADRP